MSDSPPAAHAASPAPPRKRSCLVPLLATLLLVVLAAGILWWWHNRPIQPTVLSAEERAAVERKVERIQAEARPAEPADRTYQKGGRDVVITERELNGLLHQATGLGDKLRFELADGAVHARLQTELDPDFPLLGGRTLKARARFFVQDDAGRPQLVLDDLTAWGVSLPNEWLGGLKGRDLLDEVFGAGGDGRRGGGLAGVEEFKVVGGEIRIRLKE